MKIFIYDIEVYAYDWFVGFKRPDPRANRIIIHNDVHRLRAFLNHENIVLGSFNGKHYDDYILKTIINGGTNYHVKKHNDHIISGGEPWGYNPFDYGDMMFKRLPCHTFDLRDDIADPGVSLKSIEGNLRRKIVECNVPFDIDRPLTETEIADVEKYLGEDLDGTVALYWERKSDYIDAKALICDMYNVPKSEGIGLTNAKLCARILGAKPQKFDDEREYVIPDNIDTDLIPKKILDFFLQINDKSIPDAKLFGANGSKGMTFDFILRTSAGEIPVTCAWGGIHGAKPCVTVEETKDRVIINQDVASLYPNSMLNFGYCSRAMEDPEAYRKLVEKRLGYKRAGDKLRSNALKLPINTTYGAMLNPYNDLSDRRAGRSVCISNQLAMIMLIVRLAQTCETIDFININTDGIMFSIDRKEVEISEKIVAEWSEITRFEMERDDFKKVIQKDVNNYIGITPDGKFKTKGGYVSLYAGGNFKTNSLSIIHKAVVDYLVERIPVKKTINDCTDIFAFQQIVKTGGTFEGAYQYIDGERVKIQKVNRIYAVKEQRYGQVVKGKWITEKRKKNKETGKMESTPVDPPQWSETVISECPDHAFIDNENVLTIDALDKDYYIDMAERRIDKYIHIDSAIIRKIDKIKEEVVIMATKKEEVTKTSTSGLNIYGKLAVARNLFLSSNVKKSGINRFAEFKYFELEDIVPVANKIFLDLNLVLIPNVTYESASATLVNIENPDEVIIFMAPAKDPAIEVGTKMSAIQGLGSYITYMRRYLYGMVLDLVEADAVDATIGKPSADPTEPSESKKSNRPATPEQREDAKKTLTDTDGNATDVQIKSIKNGLKKLRAKNDTYEDYISECVKKIKAGISKTDAENMLVEIGEKIEE